MTEKTAIDLLYEAAKFCGFNPADGWPAEVSPHELAALMADGRINTHRADYRMYLRMVEDAIKAGTLVIRIEQRPAYEQHCIGRPKDDGWKRLLDGEPSVREYGYTKTVTPPPIHHISPAACCEWHRAIGKLPSDHVRAWLGPAWQEDVPKVGAGRTAPAASSRPGERQACFRSIWIELDKPARNEGIWKAIHGRAGKNGCPITSAAGNKEFVFQYSDGGTDCLDKAIFQKDMSAVRKG